MTRAEKVIKNKKGLINLAEPVGKVSQACQIMGDSRDRFYRFKEWYEEQGKAGVCEMSRRKPNLRKRLAPAVEEAVLVMALEHPAVGQLWVCKRLNCFSGRGAFDLVPAWSGDLQETSEGVDRESARTTGRTGRERNRAPWLCGRSGYLLRW